MKQIEDAELPIKESINKEQKQEEPRYRHLKKLLLGLQNKYSKPKMENSMKGNHKKLQPTNSWMKKTRIPKNSKCGYSMNLTRNPKTNQNPDPKRSPELGEKE